MGVCDIEIELNQISITTKLSRDQALSYEFANIKTFPFEVAADTIHEFVEFLRKDGFSIR